MKSQWKKKKRRKNLQALKQKQLSEGVVDGAPRAGISEDSCLSSILKIMLKDIVDQGGAISMNMKDGRLSIAGEASGMILCDVSGKEAKQ